MLLTHFKGYPEAELTYIKGHTPMCTDSLTVLNVINVSHRSTVYLGHFDETPHERIVLEVDKLAAIVKRG